MPYILSVAENPIVVWIIGECFLYTIDSPVDVGFDHASDFDRHLGHAESDGMFDRKIETEIDRGVSVVYTASEADKNGSQQSQATPRERPTLFE